MSAIAALISIRIMTELLPPAEFGRLTLLIGASALALGLVSTPRLQAVIRYYPEWRKSNQLRILRQSAAAIIHRLVMMAAVVIALGGGIYSIFSSQTWHIGFVIAGLLVVDALHAFELAFFNAARRQRDAAIMQSANAWARPLMAIACAWIFGFNAEAAVAGYIAGSALILLVARTILQFEGISSEPETQRSCDSSDHAKLSSAIKRYALPLAPLAIFGWLSGMGDRYIIAGILTMQEVGLYAAAYGLASRPFLMLSTVIEQTFRPVLQNAIADGKRKDIAAIKRRMLFISIGCAATGIIAFITLKNIAGNIFLAKEYYAATTLMTWIALGYGFLCIASVYTRLCYAFDATRYVLILTTAGSLAGLLLLVPAALLYGLAGAVLVVPIRFAIELMLSIVFSQRAESRYLHFVHAKTHEQA